MRRALVILALLLVAPAPASAADFTVTTNADNTLCSPPTTTCSLRGALTSAQNNGTATQDTINLPADTYQLSSQFTALPVSANLVVRGLGSAANTRIVGGGATRVLAIAPTAQPPSPQTQILNVTITGGRALTDTDAFGGNILINAGANVLLDHVRVTNGFGLRGGGIAARGGNATLTIRNSLIDNNEARVGTATNNADGGGILMLPAPAAAATFQNLQVTDSTISFNRAVRGGGISANGTINQSRLERVTMSDNQATSIQGGALYLDDAESFQVGASIFARNQAPGPGGQNCGTIPPFDLGANVESAQDCNFTLASDRRNTTAGLATALTADGGQTPVLPIQLNSVARDLAGPCSGADQRDVVRPQGGGCDAGAYEVVVPVPTPTPTATASPTPTATATPFPTPVAGKTVVVRPQGTVKVKLPGSNRFVTLEPGALPVGATLDTKQGKVEITAIPKAGVPPQTASFYEGVFKLTQSGGITNMTLTEALAACPKKGARAAAKKPKTRRLWGSGKGNFRTTGRVSSATVRGTTYLVQDSCAGTLTRVTQGSVLVRDFATRKNIIVRAGKRYLAKPKR